MVSRRFTVSLIHRKQRFFHAFNTKYLDLPFSEEIFNIEDPKVAKYHCLSEMADYLEPWRPYSKNIWSSTPTKGPSIEIEVESGLRGGAPPIRGPCGASYRSSENYAISSGHQPFVVEIRVASKGLENKDNQVKCLGTIVTHRHILSVGKLSKPFF